MLSAANSSTVGRQHRKSAPDIASSPFLSILAKCGLQMPEDSSSIVLVDSPYVFRQKLHHHLHSMSTQDLNSITSTEAELPEAIKQFISSLEDYVSEEENLKVCLRSVEIQGECERKGNESLIKILLGIDFIQVDIIQTLVERLVQYGSEDDVSNQLEESVPKLILGQLRWLEHIVNPELLTDLMVGLIAAVDLPLQQEIILALPEVIADSQHKTVSRKLHDLLSSNSDLLVPILDTLIHLNTPEIISHEIRESVIERLIIADLNEIPVLLKFLLNIPTREEAPTNAEIDRAMQIIDLIRSKLNLEEISQVREQQTHLSQYVQGELAAQSEVSESLIFESLRSALRCHKPVREGWVKILDGVSDTRPFTQLDFFALLILNDVVPNQKRAKAIFETFRRKLSQGQVPLTIIEKCLKEHSEGLKPYQSAIVKLADFLLRSGGKGLTKRAKIAQYAKLLYQIGFEMFDIFHRQEIVAQLITHIGSNQSSEMDTSLETLLAIAQSNPKYLLAFQIFIKGVLENLDILGMSQLKILFEVFGILALQSDGGSSDSLHAELQILLRKQLQNPLYKKTGVLIATSLLKRYAAPGSTQENLQVVSEIGQMIEQFVCRKDPIALALYFDELSELVQSNAIAGEVVRAFLDDYSDGILDLMCERRSEDGDIFEVSDLENHFSQLAASVASNSRSGIPDENEDRLPYYVPKETYLENSKGGPMFALMGLISLSSSLPSQNYAGSSVVYLPALVRLYLTCHRFMREDGGQNQIDTVLRAGIILTKELSPSVFASLSLRQRQIYGSSVYYAINYVRELINASTIGLCLSSNQSKDLLEIAARRLQNVVQLEEQLKLYLPHIPNFVPLGMASALTPNSTPMASSATNGSDHVRSLKRKKVITQNSREEKSSKMKGKQKAVAEKKCYLTLTDIRSHLRPFDLHVFKLLNTNTNDSESIRLESPELRYLLEELKLALEQKLGITSSVSFFGTKKKVLWNSVLPLSWTSFTQSKLIELCVDIVPGLCGILESYFESAQVANTSSTMETARDTSEDEVIDFEESVNSHDDYEKARRKWIYLGDQLICDLILECFTLILSWPEFKASTNRDILIKIIHPLSQRGRQDASSCQTVNQHIENAVRYLETVSVSDDPMSQMELEADSSCAVKLKSPTTAYHIFKICLLLKSLDDSDETRGIIHNMAKKYILMSGWFKPSQLELMYDQEILLHDTPLEHLYELVQNLCVNDKNHFRHWKIYLKNLPDIMKTVFTDVTSDDTMRTRLLKLGEIFNRLIQQTKELSQGSKSAKVLEEKYYPMAMRYGKAVLRSFSNDGIATVTQLLRRHKAAVRDVLRNWQVANRQLIAIRSYFFKRRNNQHRQLLIDLGKQQDQLFYTLCHIAKSIGVSLAMTIGTLKHKAPNGEQIASQIGRQESSDEESDEEEDDGINLPSIDEEEEEEEENDQDDDPSNESEHPAEQEEVEEEEEEDFRIRKRPKTKNSNKFMKSTQLSDHDSPPFESIDEFTFDAVDNEIEETHSFMDSDGEIVDEGVSCKEDENGEDLMESDNDSTASF